MARFNKINKNIKTEFRVKCVKEKCNMRTLLKKAMERWILDGMPIDDNISGEMCQMVVADMNPNTLQRFRIMCLRLNITMAQGANQAMNHWITLHR